MTRSCTYADTLRLTSRAPLRGGGRSVRTHEPQNSPRLAPETTRFLHLGVAPAQSSGFGGGWRGDPPGSSEGTGLFQGGRMCRASQLRTNRRSLSCVIFTQDRRPERLTCVGSTTYPGMCTRRHTLPGSAAFRGQAEVRPPSGQAHAGLVQGQLKARRRPLALGEPPRAEAAPSKVTWLLSVRGVGPRPRPAPAGRWLTPACRSSELLKGSSLSLLCWGQEWFLLGHQKRELKHKQR